MLRIDSHGFELATDLISGLEVPPAFRVHPLVELVVDPVVLHELLQELVRVALPLPARLYHHRISQPTATVPRQNGPRAPLPAAAVVVVVVVVARPF